MDISFSQLLDADISVFGLAAVERRWANGNRNRYPAGRDENIISYTLSGGKLIYESEDKEPAIKLALPGAVFISEGSPYISKTETAGEPGHTVCVRFKLAGPGGESVKIAAPYLCWEDPDGKISKLIYAVLNAYLKPEKDSLILKSRFFALLSALAISYGAKNLPDRFKALAPAIERIRGNPADDTPITELAELCYLSESYFRTRFKEFSGGLSPVEYRNKLRIEKAEELLSSSLWTTELAAQALGFWDTAHFYRVYKQFTGRTPREIKSGG